MNWPASRLMLWMPAALRDRMLRDVAEKLDTAFIASTVVNGTGPTRLLSCPGTQQITGI